MGYRELSVVCAAAEAASLETLLEQAGALAVSVDDAGGPALLEPAPGEHPMWERCRLTGLFDDPQAADCALTLIASAHGEALAARCRLVDLAERDWVSETQAPLPASRFGRRLWVVPPGTKPPAADAVCVELAPGLAFGSGAHETTALCLEWLDRQPLAGRCLLDYGCGSGILAIAAARLGAERVLAVDHDPQALLATRCNAAANGVAERVAVGEDAGLPQCPCADLLVANILAGALIALAPRLSALLRPGAALALSGLLAAQADAVIAAYRPWCEGFVTVPRGEWLGIEARRGATTPA